MRIMRATQKKRISYAGSMTLVGWYVPRSLSGLMEPSGSSVGLPRASSRGHPSVEKVHSADENHVSSVSGSRVRGVSNGVNVYVYIQTSVSSLIVLFGLWKRSASR